MFWKKLLSVGLALLLCIAHFEIVGASVQSEPATKGPIVDLGCLDLRILGGEVCMVLGKDLASALLPTFPGKDAAWDLRFDQQGRVVCFTDPVALSVLSQDGTRYELVAKEAQQEFALEPDRWYFGHQGNWQFIFKSSGEMSQAITRFLLMSDTGIESFALDLFPKLGTLSHKQVLVFVDGEDHKAPLGQGGVSYSSRLERLFPTKAWLKKWGASIKYSGGSFNYSERIDLYFWQRGWVGPECNFSELKGLELDFVLGFFAGSDVLNGGEVKGSSLPLELSPSGRKRFRRVLFTGETAVDPWRRVRILQSWGSEAFLVELIAFDHAMFKAGIWGVMPAAGFTLRRDLIRKVTHTRKLEDVRKLMNAKLFLKAKLKQADLDLFLLETLGDYNFDFEKAKYFYGLGANLQAKFRYRGESSLHRLISTCGHRISKKECMEMLRQFTANIPDEELLPIVAMAMGKDDLIQARVEKEGVGFLEDLKVPVGQTMSHGEREYGSAIGFYIAQGNREMIKYLIDNGIGPYQGGYFVKKVLAFQGIEMLEFLFDLGYKPTQFSAIKVEFYRALKSRNIQLLRLLLPIVVSIEKQREMLPSIIVNHGDVEILAIAREFTEVPLDFWSCCGLGLLDEAKAEHRLNQVSGEDLTRALAIAVDKKRWDVVNWLLNLGAKIHPDILLSVANFGNEPLFLRLLKELKDPSPEQLRSIAEFRSWEEKTLLQVMKRVFGSGNEDRIEHLSKDQAERVRKILSGEPF